MRGAAADRTAGCAFVALQIATHPSIPYALSWGSCIVAGGNDGMVVFYDGNGREVQSFNYSGEDDVSDFSAAAFNPTGDCVVLGGFNKFYVYVLNVRRNVWELVRRQHATD